MKKVLLLLFLFVSLLAGAQEKRAWSINVGGGYTAKPNFSTDVGVLNLGVQRHLSRYFSLGGGTGVYYCDGVIIPVYADVRGYYPMGDSKFSLIGIVRTGIGIHTKGGPVAFGFEVLPGVGLNITERSFVHINLGVGSYDSETMGTIQLGYSYRL